MTCILCVTYSDKDIWGVRIFSNLYLHLIHADVKITCEDQTIMSNSIEEKEVCFDVAKTECAETKETIDTEICTYVYDEMEVDQPATTIEVEFEKKCQTHMVTVCEPGDKTHCFLYYITVILLFFE